MKISIQIPCHEDWNKMQDGVGAKFCGSCQKNVIDFTIKTETEIVDYFTQYGKEKTCGRFYNFQLSDEKPLYTAYIYHKQQFKVKNNFIGLVISFGTILLASCSNAVKKDTPQIPKTDTAKIDSNSQIMGNFSINNPETIKPIIVEKYSIIKGDIAIAPTVGEIYIPPSELGIIDLTPKATFDFDSFVNQNFNFPASTTDSSKYSNVKIELTITEDGSIENPLIIKSSGNIDIDNEALRIIKIQPKYIPANNNGINMKSNITLNIKF